MRATDTTNILTEWTQPSYTARVRGTTYLWGSAGLTVNLHFDDTVILHLRNDPVGEKVSIATRVAGGVTTPVGTLEPGEILSLQIQDISGVEATCTLETGVACVVQR